MNPLILSPTDCPKDKFDSFIELIGKGDEVISHNLKNRVENAKLLAFSYEDRKLVGVGAIKNPARTYKEKTFNKAGYKKEEKNFKYELGYIFVEKEYRKKRIGKKIFTALKDKVDISTVFATVRSDNKIMKSFLEKYGFVKLGRSYKSERGDYLVECYVPKIK